MSLLEKLKAHLESEEGKKSMEEYVRKMARIRELRDSWVERLHKNYSNRFSEILNKVIEKYDSDDYVKREYSLGYEPREPLFSLFFEYAEKYGRECTEVEWELYGNMFTGELYCCNGYYFNMMHGQGTVIKVMTEISPEEHYDMMREDYKDLAEVGAESFIAYYREKFPENYKILTQN